MSINLKHFKRVTYPGVDPNRYYVNDQGIMVDTKRDCVMRYWVSQSGYLTVYLAAPPKSGKKGIVVSVHRIVAYAFCDGYDPVAKNSVNHINGRKTINFASNLEWTTIADNYRHAVLTGLREGRATDEGEAFIHSICKRYEDGASPIEVYHELFENGPIRTKEDHTNYMYLYNIKKKKIWGNITSQYTYSTDAVSNEPKKKRFMPIESSRLTEANVHWICQQIQDGKSTLEIYEMIENGCTPDPVPETPRLRMINMIGEIGRGKTWPHISSQYDFSNRRTELTKDVSIYNGSFQSMIDQGFSKSKIVEVMCKTYGKSPNYMRPLLNRYLKSHGYEISYGGYSKKEN